MVFSSLAGIHVLYCFIAAFGDGAVLFYTAQKWGEMDVAKHLAVSQVFWTTVLVVHHVRDVVAGEECHS